MQRNKTVEEFISKFPEWKEELDLLREIMLSTEAEECIKWGMPSYTINGKNVMGLGAFKSYVGIWFHQGAFLKNKENVLVNAQEGITKGMRQWRFSNKKEINKRLVKVYALEAIENQKQGKEVKISRAKKVEPAALLEEVLSKSKKLKTAFEKMTPGKQREYHEYINDAKRESTKLSRLEKIKPLIQSGSGLNDKYK